MSSYAEKLKRPEWQKKRLHLLDKAGWHCEDCNGGEENLQVHHLFYRKGQDPWNYEDDCFEVVCETCHLRRETLTQQLRETFLKLLKFPPVFEQPDNLSEWLTSLQDALTKAKEGKRIGTPQFMPQRDWEDLKQIEKILEARK